MEVKFYVTDHHNINSSLSLSSSNVIKSHVSSYSSIIIDFNYSEFDFEMVTLGATNPDDYDNRYTSLKDISPPPELSRKESWREVPLKDPLVQQAAWAWAYLPLSTTEHHRSSTGFIRKLKDGFVGCFKNVILVITGKFLSEVNYNIDDDQETCDHNVD